MKLWLFFLNMIKALYANGEGLMGNEAWWGKKYDRIRNNLAKHYEARGEDMTDEELDRLAESKTQFFYGLKRDSSLEVVEKYASLWDNAIESFLGGVSETEPKKASYITCDIFTGKCGPDA